MSDQKHPSATTDHFSRLRAFWLLNFPLVCLILLSFARQHALADDGVSRVFFIVLSIAQTGFLTAILFGILPYLLHWMSARKISPVAWAFIIAVPTLFYLVIDSFTYAQLRTHVTSTYLAMMLSPAGLQIFDVSAMELVTFALLILAFTGLEWLLYWGASRGAARLRPWAIALQIAALFAWFTAQGFYVWGDARYDARIVLTADLTPGFYGMTAKRFLAKHHLVTPGERPLSLASQKVAKLHYPRQPLVLSPLEKTPNILVIAIDAWRHDSLTPENTPNMYALTQQSSRYVNHQSGGNCTRAGIFSLFYSASPNDFDDFYRAQTGPVLFDALYQQGYQVGIYTSASATSPPFHRTTFVNVKGFNPDMPGEDSVARDKAVTQAILGFTQRAQKEQKPYFAFAFYDSVHAYQHPAAPYPAPFQPAARVSHFTLSEPNKQALYRNQYRNALYFVDEQIGQILNELKHQGTLDNTLVILTADHGEEFDDNGLGFWGHNGNFTPAQTIVPLVVHWPGQSSAKTITAITSHYDLVPTLLKNILGVKNHIADYSIGYDLDDPTVRPFILLGSYGKMAIYVPSLQLLAVTNRLGLFHTETINGRLDTKDKIPADIYKLAFREMHQFAGG